MFSALLCDFFLKEAGIWKGEFWMGCNWTTETVPSSTCQSTISEVITVAWERKLNCLCTLISLSWDVLLVSGWYCPVPPQPSSIRMSQHVRSRLAAGVFFSHRGISGLSVCHRKHNVRRHVNRQPPAPPLLKAMQYVGNCLFCQLVGQTQTTTSLSCTTQ